VPRAVHSRVSIFTPLSFSSLHEVGLDTDWIDLAQDRDRWQVLVKAVMNLPVP